MRCTALTLLAMFLIATPAIASPAAPQESPGRPVPVFEFRSGFWINLHHFLYQLAREQRDPRIPQLASPHVTGLSADEQRSWNAAVSYYAANFADRDLLFNSDLIALKNQLGDFENCVELSGKSTPQCDAGLPKPLTQALESAAPIYRAHWWSAHDRANRRWIGLVAPLVRQSGVELAVRLAQIYQEKWPAEKIRVDLCAYSNWAGAYTTLDPLHVTISSEDPRNQAGAALEVLFHEASHGLAGPVQDAIVRECRQRGKPIPRDLWHALLFYTTGEVVKSTMALTPGGDGNPGAGADGYVPYAVREGLYTRGWEGYRQVLERYWQPYLDGRSDFHDAIVRMISAL